MNINGVIRGDKDMTGLEEMEIKIRLEGIGHALSDNLLSVPPFQRSYAWGQQNVHELFIDVADAMRRGDPEYFIGSIVVARTGGDRPEVVDGQQRLATTTILFAAIRDWFYQNGDRDRAQSIEADFLQKKDLRSQEIRPNLKLSMSDHDFFLKTILAKPDDPSRKTVPSRESHRKIIKAAELARDHVQSLLSTSARHTETILDTLEYFSKKVKIIWVVVPTYANAFTLFETLNDRGLDLAISDLLKNHIFSLSGDRLEEVQRNWTSMYGALEAAGSENLVVDYIRHLWSSYNGAIREKDLYDAIKHKINSKQSAVDYASNLSRDARLYAGIINVDHELWAAFDAQTRQHMQTINLLRMIQIRPLLIAVLSKFSPKDVNKIFPLMVSWSVRFLIVGGLGGGSMERHYSEKAKEINNLQVTSSKQLVDAMREIIPSDAQFETSFSTARVSTQYLARYYLRALEKQMQNEPQPELVPNPNEEQINLEHILPQTLGSGWDHIEPEIASTYYTRLGNLALMQAQRNTDIGNGSFREKKEEYARSSYRLTSEVARLDIWGPEQIDTRQKELARIAVLTWPNRIRRP